LLRTLDISGFAHLSRESVAAIAQGHPRLRRLIMRDCSPARMNDHHHQGDGDDVSGPAVAKGADDAAAARERASRRKAKAELAEALVGTLGASCRLLEELEFGWRRDGDGDNDDNDDAAQPEKQQPPQQPQPPQYTPAAASIQRTAPAKNWMTSTVTIDINATDDGDECCGSGSFSFTTTTAMDRLVDANPQLRRLVLDGVSSAGATGMMDDDTLELMGRRLTRLESVEFHRSADVTACGLRRLLQSARRLRQLVVRDCPRVGATASAEATTTTTGSNDAVLNAVACFGCHSLEVVDLRGSGVCHGEPAVAAVAAKCYVLRELAVDVGCHVLPPHQHGSARRTVPPVSACLSPAAAGGGRRFPVVAPLQPPQQPPRVVESLIALSPSLTRLELVVVVAVASGQPAATAQTPPRKYAPVF
jgi:hypothetical protein